MISFAGYLNTLFKITHIGTFNTSIQALALIFQVSQAQAQAASSSTVMTDRFYRTLYDSLLDPRLLSSSKQVLYLNLLFSALKADTEINRVMSFVKRLCQLFGLVGVPFLSGALFLLGELCNTTPGLKRMLIEPEDGEEHFVDADQTEGKNGAPSTLKTYDGRKREPLYAHANTSCLWEILPLTQHFHPSISLLSTQLLLSQPLSGSADISGNTLISFLDKFVYRNPKKNVAQKGASVMQPAAAAYDSGRIKMQKGAKVESEMGVVNSEAFWRKKVAEVPVDQVCLPLPYTSTGGLQDHHLTL
jgi:ribosome biogenesis protein MAK21